jgi:hypothetical protein
MRYALRDYSVTAARKGWGPGWPADRWSDMARVQAARSGVAVNVHRRIARLVKLLLDETERRGYLCVGGQTGAYNNRPISGTRTASNHSWGLAIDVNWTINFASYDGRNHGTVPAWMPDLWARYGFAWGGHYTGSFKDPMHFEFMGSPEDADDMTALALDQLRNTAATPPTLKGLVMDADVKAAFAALTTQNAALAKAISSVLMRVVQLRQGQINEGQAEDARFKELDAELDKVQADLAAIAAQSTPTGEAA